MYPYRNAWRWHLFGRYSHLVRALRDRPDLLRDPVLRQRVNGLRTWNSIRFVVSIPLSLGVMATAGSAVAALVPGNQVEDAVGGLLAIITGTTGFLTLVYLALTRLLGQLEIDLLSLLAIPAKKR